LKIDTSSVYKARKQGNKRKAWPLLQTIASLQIAATQPGFGQQMARTEARRCDDDAQEKLRP
jgi:hypothetical protein